MQYMTEAILLGMRNWGEADKMVTFLSKERGKCTAAAYGCRRPKSRLSGNMQPFSYLELSLQEGLRVDTIRQCELIRPFRRLREDLTRMAYAAFVAEVTESFCPDNHPEPEIFQLVLKVFNVMEERNPRITALAAACQLMRLSGYYPEMEVCVECGELTANPAGFSLKRGGCICSKCRGDEQLLNFNAAVREFVELLSRLDWDSPRAMMVNGQTLMQAERLLMQYLLYVLEKPLKSLTFIEDMIQLEKKTAR